jgi:hypothetical protein
VVVFSFTTAGYCLTSTPPAALFVEQTPATTGIRWVHKNAHSPKRYLPETMSGGIAIFDFDGDGWMDIFLVNSGTSKFYQPPGVSPHALYRNNRDGTFTDVARDAGLAVDLFGMGAAAADYNGDGCVDLFVTGYERTVLFKNGCNGTFQDVSAEAGVSPRGWSTSAAWLDYDHDGQLDLFVPQFLDYSRLTRCTAATAYGGGAAKRSANADTQSYYCSPASFPAMPSSLYRNRGAGVFEDVSQQTGIGAHRGKGLGAVIADVNNDGFMDIFQANDMVANFLFINRGGKTFEERGLESGVAYSQDGQVRSGMGVDASDVNEDGWAELFVANIDQQTFTLYRNDKDELFADISPQTGISKATRLLSGWGLRFFDYDNDGLLDLVLANGHPDDKVDMRLNLVTYREPLVLLRGDGTGKMSDVTDMAGPAFARKYPARGLAVGDLDNDGYPDLVVANNGEAPLVLRNRGISKNHWIGVTLKATKTNPESIGALVRWSVGGVVRSRHVRGGGSYLSSHDPRVLLGLGKASRADWIEVRWPAPGGGTDRITNVAADRYITIVEGSSAKADSGQLSRDRQ